jgi:AraC-like DNA-binding protein
MNDDGIVINIMIKKSTFKYVFFDVISSDDLLSRFFQDALYGESGMPYLYFRTGCDPNVRKCIEDAFLEYYNHRKYYEKVTKSQVNCLFAYLLRSRESYLIAGGEHKELEIYEYIRRHFMDMSLESAAKDFGYSSAYFSRYIRKITGRTYSDLVTEYRMETAVRLLRTTALSVSQISEITGYGSEEHFIRQFKKLNGKTPAAYRKENRNI